MHGQDVGRAGLAAELVAGKKAGRVAILPEAQQHEVEIAMRGEFHAVGRCR